MSLARQLEEAAAEGVVPWDLHEAYGVKTGDEMYLPRRGREPKYTGLIGQRHEKAVEKGYIDLGLVDPSRAKELGATKILNIVAHHVALILQRNEDGVAFVRDPEGIIEALHIDLKSIANEAKNECVSVFREEYDEASESENEVNMGALTRAIEKAERVSIAVNPVTGKTGRGFKFVAKPSFKSIWIWSGGGV